MRWYTAHIVMATRLLEGEQDEIPIQEDMVLFNCDTPEEAGRRAEEEGRVAEEASRKAGTTLNDAPAFHEFAGVRKVVLVSGPDGEDEVLLDGTEASYNDYVLSEEELRQLMEDRYPSIHQYS